MTTTDIHLDLVDQVRVASPCPVTWDDLEGDGATRHCGSCDMSVHNFSEMSREEVETLIRNRRGRLCGAFYRRADGTMLTRDCPVGLRAVRMRTAKLLGRVAAALGLLLAGSAVLGRDTRSGETPRLRTVQPFAALSNLVAPTPAPPAGVMIAGEIAMPPGPATGGPNGGAPIGGDPAGCGVPTNDGESGT